MLYCPKCRRTYEEGTRRFCDDDGRRLLPAASGPKNELQTGGVFSDLPGKTSPPGDAESKTDPAPRFIPLNKTEESDKKPTSLPPAGRIFQSEQFLEPETEESPESEDSVLELETPPKAEKPVPEFEPVPEKEPAPDENRDETRKNPPRLIRPGEIASGTADVGNRKTNPLGRKALSWDSPDALLCQTVKGRYRIIEELEEDDEDSLIYLAEDKIVEGKKVVVRVFMDEDFGGVEEKIFAEERVSLSHLKHPNIAGVFDSGELPEGNVFIVSEFVEGESLAEILRRAGQFDAMRTARIVRQTSYALSEAHQNGILHRSLKPENIVLSVSEAGMEQVKLMNFGVSRGEITDANLSYKAPEEIERGISTSASDTYALAVIAYQMLTARLPFAPETESALLKAQKAGLTLPPSNLRPDVLPVTDRILEKALAFKPLNRYPKARDFGDAFFNALLLAAPSNSEKKGHKSESVKRINSPREFFVVPAIKQKDVSAEESPIEADIHISPSADKQNAEPAEIKSIEPPAREKYLSEAPKTGSFPVGWLAILGAVLFLLGFWGVLRFISNRSEQPENIQNSPVQNEGPVVPIPGNPSESSFIELERSPAPRLQTPPPDARRFQNAREDQKGELAEKFLGFEIFYPQDWQKTDSPTNFLDISKRDPNGFPIEQMLVTRYESNGTMSLDRPNFPQLVEASNRDLKKSLGESFRVISEGETTIQNGRWKVYEVKFQSTGENEKGESITLWGRRLWLPVQRAGTPNGFVITLLATSLSDSVKSADEVGVRGQLANVLETFEPEAR